MVGWQTIAEQSAGVPVPVHGERRRFAGVMIKARQDGFQVEAGAAIWPARLVEADQRIEAEAVRCCGPSPGTYPKRDQL